MSIKLKILIDHDRSFDHIDQSQLITVKVIDHFDDRLFDHFYDQSFDHFDARSFDHHKITSFGFKTEKT